MKIPVYQADAFTSKLFGGNPAAVVPLCKWLEDDLMQSIAMENNLSETAFFVPEDDDFHLRWFTPTVEVDLCGHATLASAHVLFEELGYERDEITFRTKSGLLSVVKENGRLKMDFPVAELKKTEASEQLLKALNVAEVNEVYFSDDILVVLDSEHSVSRIKPDYKLLESIETRGVIVTAAGEGEKDFVSRFFAPRVGVDEDPVTGSTHTKLIPYWSKRLGKHELYAHQISKRGGELFCKMKNDRVEIAGKAITYLKGEIKIA